MAFNEKLYFCGDDLIQRGLYAKNLKTIISECHEYPKCNDNESYVIGINAPWGSGKTHFVNMLYHYLCGSWINPKLNKDEIKDFELLTGTDSPKDYEPMSVIYYDAWENDFWDNAFEPFFDKIINSDLLYELTAEQKDIKDMLVSTAKIIAYGVKGFLLKKIEDNFDTGEIENIINELKKIVDNASNVDFQTGELFPEYVAFRNAISLMRKYLQKCIDKTDKKIVIIVDELDRCKPTFAVQTLEIVKHLFNVRGIVFIFSLDIKQLSECVKTVYGNDFDAVGYLERFFNYLTMLPRNNTYTVFNKYLQEFSLNFDEISKDSLINITRIFDLSLRDIRTILCSYYVLSRTSLKKYENEPDATILYFYFLSMKYKYPNLFNLIHESDMSELVNFIKFNPIPFVFNKEEDSILDINEIFIETISSKNSFAYSQLYIKDRVNNFTQKTIKKVSNDNVYFSEGTHRPLDSVFNCSFVLFKCDLVQYETIKELYPLEYIFRNLELCDFSLDNYNED